jgi:hypothetical protein
MPTDMSLPSFGSATSRGYREASHANIQMEPTRAGSWTARRDGALNLFPCTQMSSIDRCTVRRRAFSPATHPGPRDVQNSL